MKFLCSQTAVLVLVTLSCADPVQSQSNGPGFVLSVRIHRYMNPTHRLGMSIGNRCCDSEETFDCVNPCDNAFSFCLRPYGYPQQADGCPLGAYTVEAFCFSSDVEERDCDMLLFNSSDDSFGSAPNPLIFSGESWPGGFQLLTEVEDQDVNPDDFVDRIITEQWLSPESGNTIQMESPGEFNFGFLRMSFNVICNENFGGPNCTTNCGVEGCTLDPCSSSPCQNGGSCVSTGPPSQYSCQCVEGFEGDSCDEPLSDDSTDMLGSRGSNTGTAAIVGGVMGGVVLVLLVLVVAIIVLLVVCRRRQNEDQTYLKPDSVTGGGFEPGDNPNYTAATGTHAHYAESGLYHKLENPLYTAVENHEYATPDTHSPRGGSGVRSGHYSTVSKAAPPSRPPHHYEYVVNSSSNDSPTAVSHSNKSELSNSSNHHEFNNTLYEQLLH